MILKMNTPIEEVQEVIDLQEVLKSKYDLIVYNDDVNTFEHVIASLVDICEHQLFQAEQCTWIIHHNGKCSVKRGSFEKLEPMHQAFMDRQISAKIEC
jgi:ATP-dependent Clp protease adaptor protein ClpS